MPSPTSKKSLNGTSGPSSRGRLHRETAAANGRKRYAHEWDEITDLFHNILDAYYGHGDRRRALRYAPRLERLLRQEASNHEAIFGEECWSLLSELRGDLPAAIAYRRSEIRLIRKLWKTLPGSPDHIRAFLLKRHGPDDLSDRLDLLAMLYHDAGQLKKAIRTLWQSRELCELHGVRFDGNDLLRDYLAEHRAASVKR